jgi:hypothetical protein
MTASYNFIVSTGTVVADTSAILADVEAEFANALGQSIDTDASTPQGALIAAEAIARTSVMKNNSDLANNINPNLSYGVFLDAICAFLGTQRGVNASTIGNGVKIDGDGINTITVPAGSRVETINGDIFDVQVDTTIPNGGTAQVTLVSEAFGNIPLPVGNLTIIDGTIGWGDAIVTAATVVTPGTIALTDPQLKIARNRQLAAQGVGSSAAILAAASQVPNVTSVLPIENNTGQTAAAVNGVTFTLPNAMWVCVAGSGAPASIAAALYAAHGGGCPWDYGAAGEGVQVQAPNGVKVLDPATGLPYFVKYVTPNLFDVYVQISVHQNNSVVSPAPSIQNAMVAYATGQEDGEPGLVAGASVSAFEFAGAIARQLPGIYIKSCAVACVPAGSPAPTVFSPEVIFQPWQQGQLASGNIAVSLV